jgi:hypothetical protein
MLVPILVGELESDHKPGIDEVVTPCRPFSLPASL